MFKELPTVGQPASPPATEHDETIARHSPYDWGIVVDTDRCSGCQACVVACEAENNIEIAEEQQYLQRRPIQWIRIERYWEGEFPNVKARYLPVMCQHCKKAPCEPVCPVTATYHSSDGLNIQVYNRCIGTRYCNNNCQWNVRVFNYREHDWPEPLTWQLNPDVTIRTKGIMEKCSMCVQRVNRAKRTARQEGRIVEDGEFAPACVQSCPTDALVFGNWKDPDSRINQLAQDERSYELLGELGTEVTVRYLRRVDLDANGEGAHA